MKITFTACLQGTTTMKLDDDNSGILKLTFDGSQWPRVAQLSAYQRQALRVTIELESKL